MSICTKNSPAQSAGELWPLAKMAKVTLRDLIFIQIWVFEPTFWSQNARKSITGSKDSDDNLVSKKARAIKMARGLAPRAR